MKPEYTVINMYVNRSIYLDRITPFLGDDLVIVLHGARQVGKSTLLLQLGDILTSKGKIVISYDLERPNLLESLNKGEDGLLNQLKKDGLDVESELYVMIDEVQYLDDPSNLLKLIADHHKNIHLIVSGSSSFDIKSKFSDSLVGRTINFEIYPLSFLEFLDFKSIKLVPKLADSKYDIEKLKTLYEEYVRYGGYPRIVLEDSVDKKSLLLLQIIDTYVRKDLRDLAQIEDITKFNNLLYLLSKQSGELINVQSLGNETGLGYNTLQKYLSILEATYVIKILRPYSKSPSVEISKNPKVFFYDSGLQSILWQKNFFELIPGSVLETAVFSDIVKAIGNKDLRFWRTKQQNEVDFIIDQGHSNDPKAIEVKTSFNSFSRGKFNTYLKRYPSSEWRVVGLGGTKTDNCIYPWELSEFLD